MKNIGQIITLIFALLCICMIKMFGQDIIVKTGGVERVHVARTGDVTIYLRGPAEVPPAADPIFHGDYFVATDGNDAWAGTQDRPFATWQKGFTAAQPGDTVYIRGGTYTPTGSTNGVYLNNKDGSLGNRINIWAYPGETPVLDCSGLTIGAGNQYGIYFNGGCSYWYLKGLEIKNVPQNNSGMLAEGIRLLSGDYNIFESMKFHGIEGTGIGIYNAAEGNLLWHCDSYNNVDPHSGIPGNNADGMTVGYIYERAGNERVNTVRGCRSWSNSDDGFDFMDNAGVVVIDSCWSFDNGKLSGNGNGFKLGGGTEGTPEATAQRTFTNCLAFHNKELGFSQNNSMFKMIFYNNVAYGNLGRGWHMGWNNTVITMKNNITYANVSANVFLSNEVHDHNTWDASPAVTVSGADFVSTDTTGVSGARGTSGQLPVVNFLKLQTGSDLINAGTDVGITYQGAAPDLGPYEKQ
jgi:hypothetical protein